MLRRGFDCRCRCRLAAGASTDDEEEEEADKDEEARGTETSFRVDIGMVGPVRVGELLAGEFGDNSGGDWSDGSDSLPLSGNFAGTGIEDDIEGSDKVDLMCLLLRLCFHIVRLRMYAPQEHVIISLFNRGFLAPVGIFLRRSSLHFRFKPDSCS